MFNVAREINYSNLIFHNSVCNGISISNIISEIEDKIKVQPLNTYVLTVGTDSQVIQTGTRFVSAIHLHRVGKGAWAWRMKTFHRRPINNLKEKILTECFLTQNIMIKLVSQNIYDKVADIIIPHIDKGANFIFKPHVDIGLKGETKTMVTQIDEMFKSIGFDVVIKPYSYTASSYANKYTKF